MLPHLLPCPQVPKPGPAPSRSDVAAVISDTQGGKRQQAYKTEIIGGVVVHTPIQVTKSSGRTNDDERFALISTVAFILSKRQKQCSTAWRWPPKPLCVSSAIFEDGSYMIASVIQKNGYDETFQNESEEPEGKERKGTRPGVVRCSYCVKQGNVVSTHSLLISSVFVTKNGECGNLKRVCVFVSASQRKSWKRRFFTLDDNAVSYYKSEMVKRVFCFLFFHLKYRWSLSLSSIAETVCMYVFQDKEPLRSIPLRDIQKVHECLVKSGWVKSKSLSQRLAPFLICSFFLFYCVCLVTQYGEYLRRDFIKGLTLIKPAIVGCVIVNKKKDASVLWLIAQKGFHIIHIISAATFVAVTSFETRG